MSGKTDFAMEALVRAMKDVLNSSSEEKDAVLWCADEHPIEDSYWQSLATLRNSQRLNFLTNRLDQFRQAQKNNIRAELSDFVFPCNFSRNLKHVFVRAPKERALVHYLINQAFLALPDDGRLWLFGFKGEGIKTHIQKARQLFKGDTKTIKGKNQLFCSEIIKNNSEKAVLLDDQNYSDLVWKDESLTAAELPLVEGFWTKPGVYGWNKVDQGSQFLAETLLKQFDNFKNKTVLDLGCGYGYLSFFAASMNANKVIATDNSVTALSAIEKNIQSCDELDFISLASDGGDLINEKVDLILCNPPFHQGFSMNETLHYRFMLNIKRILIMASSSIGAERPQAWFVVNQFLALEAQCNHFGLQCAEVSRNKSFKILKITA